MGSPPQSPSLPRRDDLLPQPPRRESRAGMVSRKRRAQKFDIPNETEYRELRIFFVYGYPRHDVGWKLHVVKPSGLNVKHPYLPASYSNLLIHLFEMKVPHKIVFSLEAINAMESRQEQCGKFITIYPRDVNELLALPDQIEACIRKDAIGSPTASGDRSVAVGVSARWGGLTGPCTVNQLGRVVQDDRTRPYPDWIRDVFDPHSQGADVWTKIDLAHDIREERSDFKQQSAKLSRIPTLQEE
jgi:hypothetical protein